MHYARSVVEQVASPRIRELIRQGAAYALDPPQVWRDEVDDAVFAGSDGQRLVDDPELAATARRVIVSTLSYWVRANYLAPGEPVPTEVSDAPLTMARDLVRRGMDDTALDAYRVGQSVAWRHWMQVAFELTDDRDELRELLDVTSRSIATFVNNTVDEVRSHMRAEREQLHGDVQAHRRETVALILQGAPITSARAESRLGYRLDRRHYACVIWSDDPEPDIGVLGDVVDVLTRPGVALTVAASTGTRWVWTTTEPPLLDAAGGTAPRTRRARGGCRAGLGSGRVPPRAPRRPVDPAPDEQARSGAADRVLGRPSRSCRWPVRTARPRRVSSPTRWVSWPMLNLRYATRCVSGSDTTAPSRQQRLHPSPIAIPFCGG